MSNTILLILLSAYTFKAKTQTLQSVTGNVEAEGINLREMNAKLLQKTEGLTLHLIEQNKLIESLTNRNKKQQGDLQF